MQVCDLFCGLGGFSAGAIEAGAEVILGVDRDSVPLKLWAANVPGGRAKLATLGSDCTIDLPPPSPSLYIHSSPPCTDLSPARGSNVPAADVEAGLQMILEGKSSSRSRTFLCDPVHFTVVPGRVGYMTRTVPKGSGIAGKNLRVVVSVEKQAVRGSSFALTDLLLMSGAASESRSEAADEEVVEKAPSVADTEPMEIKEAEPHEESGTNGHGFVAQDDQVTLMADETIEGETPGTEAAPAASVNLGDFL